jgi:Subtilisin inhibitor-like
MRTRRAVAGRSLRQVRLGLVGVALLVVVGAGCTAAGGTLAGAGPGGPSQPGTDLTIMVEEGPETTTWRLACDPPDGSHPDPERACAALAAEGAAALPPVSMDVACTEIWGGRQRATLTGTWQGQRVDSSFSRANGCEIERWDRLGGLLPPGGI